MKCGDFFFSFGFLYLWQTILFFWDYVYFCTFSTASTSTNAPSSMLLHFFLLKFYFILLMEMQSFTCTSSFMGMGFWRGFVVVSWFWVLWVSGVGLWWLRGCGFVVNLWLWVCGYGFSVVIYGCGGSMVVGFWWLWYVVVGLWWLWVCGGFVAMGCGLGLWWFGVGCRHVVVCYGLTASVVWVWLESVGKKIKNMNY